MKTITLFIPLLFLALTIKAQKVASIKISNPEIYEMKRDSKKIIPILKETVYTYRYNKGNVIVYFKDGEHIEYFNNKQYFIKSTLTWITPDECFMILQESNLPDFPFKKGAKLKMKILKIKNKKVFYKSTLGGRTWFGKMKLKENN